MSNPLRHVLRRLGKLINGLRLVVVNGLFVVVLLLVLVLIFGGGPRPLPEEAPLRLELSGLLVDQRSYVDPLAGFLSSGQPGSSETVVREVVTAIDAAADDPRIPMLVLELEYLAGGDLSKLQEIGAALERFKESGKEILATGNLFTQAQYYLGSRADEIYLHPMGGVVLTGLGQYRPYFQEALEKLGVNLHVFRVGSYKDAVEPFTRSEMSEASREQNSRWIEQLWSVYTSDVESQRELPRGAIGDYVSNLDEQIADTGGDAARLALENQLVDRLATRGELQQELSERFGQDPVRDGYRATDYQDYLAHLEDDASDAADTVGLVVASGTIYDGEQLPGNIGGESLARLIRQAREEQNVDSLVLRIDSGGGSAYAAERIRREIVATRDAGIPVVVSMGGLAASGGYWIAADADEIWATPSTLTGSIGVFSVIPTFENSLDRLGINTDGYGTNELAGAMRLDMPMDSITANVLQENVEHIYQRFLGIVSEGRDIPVSRLEQVAEGRVWSGIAAQELGLVDELGFLNEAVAAAASHMDSENYRVELVEQRLSPWERFFQGIGPSALQELTAGRSDRLGELFSTSGERPQWGRLRSFVQLVRSESRPLPVYAHCLYCSSPF